MGAPFFSTLGDGTPTALALAVGLGIAFGWALERAGLGSARVIAGQFYGRDFTVFKVMFSALLTAMLGVFWLGRLDVLDVSRLDLPPTAAWAQLVGGLVFGVGFLLAGLCPGTSCVAAASGRLDGVLVVAGMFAGVLAAGLGFERLTPLYGEARALTLPDLLRLPYGVVVALVVAIALAAFAGAERLERRR